MNVTVTDATNTVEVVGPQQVVVTAAAAQVVVEDAGAQGPTGPTGPAGPTGATGPAGPGVAIGGTAGQLLVKASATDYDTSWQNDPLYPTLPAGSFISQPTRVFSGGAPAKDTVWYMPFIVRGTRTIDRIGWYQWNGNPTANAVVRLGFYANSGYNRPGSLIADEGTLAMPAGGFQFVLLSVNRTFTSGLYFAAWVHQGTQTTGSVGQGEGFGFWTQSSYGVDANAAYTGMAYSFVQTSVTGALPATATPGNSLSAGPRIFLRTA